MSKTGQIHRFGRFSGFRADTRALWAAVFAGVLGFGCAGEAGSQGQLGFSGQRDTVQSAGSVQRPVSPVENTIVDSSPRGSLAAETLQQRLLLVPRPPKIVANSVADLGDALTYASRSLVGELDRERGARWTEAAQIGLLFGAPEGKAYLSAPGGRALVRGVPAESCPALHVASAADDRMATEGAMRACLNALSARPDCGCRLLASGDRLFAKREDFAYAIGVGTNLIDPASGRELRMASEERVVDGRAGARHVWILGVDGPYGLLQVEADGRAALLVSATGERFDGTHRADGFRRGRIARRAYLTSKTGSQLIVLVGYEGEELDENRPALAAWNPYGDVQLKQAEAN